MARIVRSLDWTVAGVRREQARIKGTLDEVARASGKPARLRAALDAIAELEDDDRSVAQLRRYVYIMSALVHHEKDGGLSQRQIRRLVELADAILQAQGVKPVTSRLSFLHGDLHLVMSQIERQWGFQWRSAWEQQVAAHIGSNGSVEVKAHQALSAGIRAARLGHLSLAAGHLSQALDGGALPTEMRRRGTLYRISGLRLLGQLDAAGALIATLRSEKDLSEAQQRDVDWESFCLLAQNTGDLAPMLAAIRRKRPHYKGTYICEAILWAMASQSTAWVDRLPAMSTLLKAKIVSANALGHVFHCAQQLERCHDRAFPFHMRMRELGEVLGELSKLLAYEQELLMWLAATRWLARNNAFSLAALTYQEYRSACLRATDGRSSDCLGLAADLEQRHWAARSAEDLRWCS